MDKEQLYEVEFWRDHTERYLLMELSEGSYEIVSESENEGYRSQWFTEEQIKAIDSRFWAFAVPVAANEP